MASEACEWNVCLLMCFFLTCVLRFRVTPSSIPWASASVSVTLLSLATPPGDITRLWDTAVCDRVVLGGRLETDRWEIDRKVRVIKWVYNIQLLNWFMIPLSKRNRDSLFMTHAVVYIQTGVITLFATTEWITDTRTECWWRWPCTLLRIETLKLLCCCFCWFYTSQSQSDVIRKYYLIAVHRYCNYLFEY